MKKNMVRIVDNSQPRKDYEEKRYLICYEDHDGNKWWDIVIGRTTAYEYIKDLADVINFDESFILVETLSLKDKASLYAFMKQVQDNYNDGFDIDEYIKGDFDEDEFMYRTNLENSDVYNAISDNTGKLDMKDFMDGIINMNPIN